MESEKRQSDTPLRDRLFKEFYSFSFFKAVDLLESLLPDKKPLGQTLTPGEEAVRFSSKSGLSFPASDISKIEHSDKERPVDMEVTFMGLIGPSGVLPHWYNEQVMERTLQKDFGLKAFYDIFHHRLISLFYLAWKKHQLAANYLPGAKDKLSSYFLSVIGLGTGRLVDMIGFPDKSTVYYYSGLLSRPVPSSVAIEATVGYFAGVSVHVQQFIDQLLPISEEDQTQIGLSNGRLGIDAICGSYVWDNQTKFRIKMGPIGYDDFLRFLPTGEMFHPTFSLVRYMVGIEYEFDICLILKREEVPPCILGEETPGSSLLGLSTWIKTPGIIHNDDPYVTFQEADS